MLWVWKAEGGNEIRADYCYCPLWEVRRRQKRSNSMAVVKKTMHLVGTAYFVSI